MNSLEKLPSLDSPIKFLKRMIDFIEITLTTAFVINKSGRERMKFIFTFNKVHPGFNLKLKNRKGLFPLGKDGHHKEEAVAEEEN